MTRGFLHGGHHQRLECTPPNPVHAFKAPPNFCAEARGAVWEMEFVPFLHRILDAAYIALKFIYIQFLVGYTSRCKVLPE